MSSMQVPVGAVLALTLLTGCEARDASTPEPPQAPAASPPAAQPAPTTETKGGDGSPIVLTPLSADEISGADLAGELGCSFSTANASILLIAKGAVASKDAAQGLVKVGDYVERVAAPGGFDAMLKGGVFSGAGKTLRVTITGPAIGGGESPPWPATMTYERADGASRTFEGRWHCGP